MDLYFDIVGFLFDMIDLSHPAKGQPMELFHSYRRNVLLLFRMKNTYLRKLELLLCIKLQRTGFEMVLYTHCCYLRFGRVCTILGTLISDLILTGGGLKYSSNKCRGLLMTNLPNEELGNPPGVWEKSCFVYVCEAQALKSLF